MHLLILARFRFSTRSTENHRDKIASRNGTSRKFVIDPKFDSISTVPEDSPTQFEEISASKRADEKDEIKVSIIIEKGILFA